MAAAMGKESRERSPRSGLGRPRVIDGGRRSRKTEFERLYRESYDRVYSYVRLRMGDDPYVEDVVAEAYLKAASAFDRFDPARAQFSTWVIRIAINATVDHWRRTRSTVALEDVPESAFAVADDTDSLSDRELVGQLLAMLSPEEANLVLMKYRDGKRNVDIATELGMNPSTVASKLYNAIHRMRDASEG